MTKIQKKRKERYEKALRNSGFRSWVSANNRRFELISSREESPELNRLQELSSLYVKYKTNDMIGRGLRRLKRFKKALDG